jgi:glyoxylase-like metal-dependent hydrolase (beta-lactamase superfamily II)
MHIDRRRFIILSSAAAAAAPFRNVIAQTPPATRFETIRGNVGYFFGKGGTIGWLINKDAVVVVDTQFADTAAICLEGLKQKSSRGIDVLFNTHHHGDHTSGNPTFKPATKKIVAHAKVPDLQKQAAAAPPPAGQPAPPAPVVADTTFDSTWSVDAGDETISARHYGPAHTGGDSIIRFERANVVHMGDLLFVERHPFVDRPAGASIQNWMKTLEKVAAEMPADTQYIAGHSKPDLPVVVSRAEVLKFKDYLNAVLSHAQKGIAAGQTKEAITASKGLAGFEGYQEAPPRLTLAAVLGVAYDELTAR